MNNPKKRNNQRKELILKLFEYKYIISTIFKFKITSNQIWKIFKNLNINEKIQKFWRNIELIWLNKDKSIRNSIK
jgi:hypothetical protein